MLKRCCYNKDLCILLNCSIHSTTKNEEKPKEMNDINFYYEELKSILKSSENSIAGSETNEKPQNKQSTNDNSMLFDVKYSREVFNCKLCERIFNTKLAKIRHEKRHNFCKLCRMNFKSSRALGSHQRNKHREFRFLTVNLSDVSTSKKYKEIYKKALKKYEINSKPKETENEEVDISIVKLEPIENENENEIYESINETCLSIKIETSSEIFENDVVEEFDEIIEEENDKSPRFCRFNSEKSVITMSEDDENDVKKIVGEEKENGGEEEEDDVKKIGGEKESDFKKIVGEKEKLSTKIVDDDDKLKKKMSPTTPVKYIHLTTLPNLRLFSL